MVFDFATRQKVQGQTLNLFILEQLPVVPLERYEAVHFGPKTAAEIVREAVLELTYTAHDMAPFARECWRPGRDDQIVSSTTLWSNAEQRALHSALWGPFNLRSTAFSDRAKSAHAASGRPARKPLGLPPSA